MTSACECRVYTVTTAATGLGSGMSSPVNGGFRIHPTGFEPGEGEKVLSFNLPQLRSDRRVRIGLFDHGSPTPEGAVVRPRWSALSAQVILTSGAADRDGLEYPNR